MFRQGSVNEIYFLDTYIFRNKKKTLYLVGTAHINDPRHPMYRELKSIWNKFLDEEANQKNRLVMIEGGIWSLVKNSRRAITEYGEASFMVYLAWKAGVTVISPEPDEKFEIEELLKHFKKDEIMYYYFVRLVSQWQRVGPKQDLVSYINMGRYKDITGWKSYDFSVQHFIKIHDRLNKHRFNKKTCHECLSTDPAFHKVSLASGIIRDKIILKVIKRHWRSGKSAFVVFGSWHINNIGRKLMKELQSI